MQDVEATPDVQIPTSSKPKDDLVVHPPVATSAAQGLVDLENQSSTSHNKQAVDALSELKAALLTVSTSSTTNNQKKRNHETMNHTGDQAMLNSSVEFCGYAPPTKKPALVNHHAPLVFYDDVLYKQHQRPVPNNVLPPATKSTPRSHQLLTQHLPAQPPGQPPQKYHHPVLKQAQHSSSTVKFPPSMPQRIHLPTTQAQQQQQPSQPAVYNPFVVQQQSPPQQRQVSVQQQASVPQHSIVTPEKHCYALEEVRARIQALANNVHGSIQPMGPYLTEAQHIAILRHLEYASAIMYQRNAQP